MESELNPQSPSVSEGTFESELNPQSPSVSKSTFESERKKRKSVVSDGQASKKKKSKVSKVEGAGGKGDTNQDKKNKNGGKPAAAASSPPYTWFLAIQISDPSCHQALRKAQEAIIESNPVFLNTMVAVSKSHITLFLFNLDQDGVTDAKLNDLVGSIEKAVKDWRENDDNKRNTIDFKLNEVGHFGGKVVFVRPVWRAESPFPGLWRALATHLLEDGFIKEKDGDLERLKPHVTICKMSRVKKWKMVKKLPRSFPSATIDSLQQQDFGEQKRVASLQLLSMTKPPVVDPITKGSYYHCHKEFFLSNDRPQQQEGFDEHELCCRTPLQTKSNKETNSGTPASTSLFKDVAAMPLLLMVGGGLLALTIARHFFLRR